MHMKHLNTYNTYKNTEVENDIYVIARSKIRFVMLVFVISRYDLCWERILSMLTLFSCTTFCSPGKERPPSLYYIIKMKFRWYRLKRSSHVCSSLLAEFL